MKNITEQTKLAITLGLIPWIPAFILYKHSLLKAAVIVLAVFILLSLMCFVSKQFASLLNKFLDKTSGFIGKYIAIIVLSVGYLLAVLPTGLLMKIVKRDRLRLKKPDVQTYWLDYENKNTDYGFQF